MSHDHHREHTNHRLILTRILKGIGSFALVAALLAFYGVSFSGSPVHGIAAAINGPANGKCMTFEPWTDTNAAQYGMARDYIFADGRTCPNTPQDLLAAIEKANAGPGTTVVLNSPGGDLGAGVEMGRIIRRHQLDTQVGAQYPYYLGLSPVPSQDNSTATGRDQRYVPYIQYPVAKPFPGQCMSACNFALLGGVHRSVGLLSDFGAHQFDSTVDLAARVEALRKELLKSYPEEEVNRRIAAMTGHLAQQAKEQFEQETQQAQAELAVYLQDMGIDVHFLTEMAKKSGHNIWNFTHLDPSDLIRLRVVTPRWVTDWGFKRANTPSREISLQGQTTDMWGQHVLNIVCRKEGSSSNSSTGVYLEATLDPGGRVGAAKFAKDITGYVFVLDNGSIPVPAGSPAITKQAAATEDGRKISAAIQISREDAITYLLKTQLVKKENQEVSYIGNDNIGIMLESKKNPTVHALQFVWRLDPDIMRKYLLGPDCVPATTLAKPHQGVGMSQARPVSRASPVHKARAT